VPQPQQTFHILQPRPYPGKLSLVIPMYNEEAACPLLREALEQFLPEVPCPAEVILVNDGSSDATLEILSKWAKEDSRIKVIHFSRNFGHQYACSAGLDYASGDAVVMLDADLQHPLPVIHAMISRYCEGYDVAYAAGLVREGESWFKRVTAWLFYRLMRSMVYKSLPADAGDFRLISRECLDGLKQMRETHRFLRGMVAWIGYAQIAVPYERKPRVAGESKYPLRKMLSFAWTAATSFSILPLRISTLIGVMVTLFGLAETVRALLAHFLHWYTVTGWTSLIVTICVIGGSMLMSIGILGEYIGKIYEEAKDRPRYIVARTLNFDASESTPQTPALTRAEHG
jgi:polyisoprenyl-phosphate glycosyltransferase